MASTEKILRLVATALDEFDELPLEATVRRAKRTATLLGDMRSALRCSFELKPSGGSATENDVDICRLMADPSTWSQPDNDAEAALVDSSG